MKVTIFNSALLASLCCFSAVSQAFEYFVVNQAAKVFTAPNGNEVMTQLMRGNVLLEIDQQGDWSKVFFLTAEKQPLKGWVLSEKMTAQQQGGNQPVNDGGEYYTVAVNGLRLRSGPGGEHPVMGSLKRDQMVKKLHRDGEWVKVRYRNDSGNTAQAWTAIKFLKPAKSEAQVKAVKSVTKYEEKVESNKRLFRVKGKSVNFRSGPGTEYSIVGQLSNPQRVSVISSKKEWKQISVQINGAEISGWVLGRFVKAL